MIQTASTTHQECRGQSEGRVSEIRLYRLNSRCNFEKSHINTAKRGPSWCRYVHFRISVYVPVCWCVRIYNQYTHWLSKRSYRSHSCITSLMFTCLHEVILNVKTHTHTHTHTPIGWERDTHTHTHTHTHRVRAGHTHIQTQGTCVYFGRTKKSKTRQQNYQHWFRLQ